MKLSEAVREVIRLGDASRADWDRELPRYHPDYPWIHPGEVSAPPPPENAQIQSLLKGLLEDQIYSLIVLTYVGRGDFDADELSAAYQTMKKTFPSKDQAITQILGKKKILAEYLTDAMGKIQQRHIDLDNVKFASATVAGWLGNWEVFALPSNAISTHLNQLLKDANELGDIHRQLKTGLAGSQYGLASLNRAAVVICVSAWESYIEELMRESLMALQPPAHPLGHCPALRGFVLGGTR